MLQNVPSPGPPRPSSPLFLRKSGFPAPRATPCASRSARPGIARSGGSRDLAQGVGACWAAQVETEATVLTRDDGRFYLDVVSARRVRDLDDEGLALIALREMGLQQLVVTAEDLKAEPRRSNVSLAWSYKDRPVSVPLRLHILKTLADEGTVALLLEMIRADQDPSPAVMSLACSVPVLLLSRLAGVVDPCGSVERRSSPSKPGKYFFAIESGPFVNSFSRGNIPVEYWFAQFPTANL
jgi:hypothetical protein